MAGVSTKEIKNRIRSMESTKQITKAMEMVAASKLRRAQDRVASSRPYFEILYQTIVNITVSNRDFTSPFLTSQKPSKIMYIVIAGDRGLAGGYNSSILKMVEQEIRGKNAEVFPIGKKAVEFFHGRGIPAFSELYNSAEEVSIGDCFSIAHQLCRAYLSGGYSEIHVAFTNFESLLSQSPEVRQLLPLRKPDANEHTVSHTGIIYEPDSEEVFAHIIPEYLGGVLYGALCESRASEQAARRTAMDNATQNAEDMIADLSLKFNRARQAAITQEITEIVAGS